MNLKINYMKDSLLKTLLIVGCVLGVLQGLMTFIGGCIAACDKHKDLKADEPYDTSIFIGDIESNGIALKKNSEKYMCGFIHMEKIPSTPISESEIDDFDYGKMDRGWFQRVYKICKDGDCSKNRLNGFKTVLTYAILCGICWIGAGGLSFFASMKMDKLFALISGIIFSVTYIIFIGLFGATWKSVKDLEDDCPLFEFKSYKKQAKKSSREFLGYSICSFILILGAIACTLLPAFTLGSESQSNNAPGSSGRNIDTKGHNPEDNKGYKNVPDQSQILASNDQSQISQANEPKNNPPVNKNPYPNTREDVKMPTGVSLAGKDFAGQFVKLNKYLIDDKKMTAYADKQFKKTDKDNSGTLELKEFKAFVTGIMTNKRLPPPSDRKVLALMKK